MSGKLGSEQAYIWGEEAAPAIKKITTPHPFLPLVGLHVKQMASTALSTMVLTGT